MIIELNARRNYTERFLTKKNLKRRQRNSTKERGREIVFRYSRESDSPRASTCSTCPPSEDLSVLHILLLSHPFTYACAYTFTSTANVPTHFSPLPTETLALPSIFFSFFLFEIHSFPFVFLSIQNYSIFIYI